MAWRRAFNTHQWNLFGVSTFGIGFAFLRCSVGFGPNIHDRKMNDLIIESDERQFASVSLKGKSSPYKWKPYNQDSYFYHIVDGFRLFGVCDGHGPKGHDVSSHIAQQISDYVEKTQHETLSNEMSPNIWLQNIVSHTVKEIDTRSEIETKRSGSTLVFSYIHTDPIDNNKRTLYTANVGDSRAIIIYRNPNIDWILSTKQLNIEHNAKVKSELKRIYDNGGYVDKRGYVSHSATPYGINMSRSLGDDDIHYNNIVSSDPDIMKYDITDNDICIVVGTDGIWDMMDNSEVAAIVSNNLPDLKQAAIEIVNECENRWRMYAGRVDDITISIFSLKQYQDLLH